MRRLVMVFAMAVTAFASTTVSFHASAAAGTGCTYRTASQYYCRAGAYQYVTADGA